MSEWRINLNILQARKIADYLNKADWHAARNNPATARCLQGAYNVLMGVKDPDEGPIHELHEGVKKALETKKMPRELRDLAFTILADIEQSLYVPMKAREREGSIES